MAQSHVYVLCHASGVEEGYDLGFTRGGEKDGIGAAVFLDAGGGGEMEVPESAGFELAREGVAVEAEVVNALAVRVEGAVFGVQVGQGEKAAGGEEGEELPQDLLHVGDVMEGHGGGEKVVGAGGEGMGGKIGLQKVNVEETGGLLFLSEAVEHAAGGVDGGDAADARGEGEGQQAGAAAVVEGGETGLKWDLFFDGGKNIGGELEAAGVFIPGGGACVKGVAHGEGL